MKEYIAKFNNIEKRTIFSETIEGARCFALFLAELYDGKILSVEEA